MLSSSIPSIATLADEVKFSLLHAVSLPLQLVPLSQSHGKDCSPHGLSSVSVSGQRTRRSPSTRLRWLRLGFEVLSSCSGNFGSWQVSNCPMLDSRHWLTVACRYLPGLLRQRHCQRHWSHRLASATRFGVHPVLHPRLWYLLLSRVPSLAHEARQARPRIQINVALASK